MRRSKYVVKRAGSNGLHAEGLEPRLLLAFDAVAPAAALVFQTQVTGQILAAGDTSLRTLRLDADQQLSLALSATDGLVADFEMWGPDGLLAAAQQGPSFELEAIPISETGTYYLQVGGEAGSVGSYVLDVFLNASLEDERYGGPANDSLTTAESLAPADDSGQPFAVVGGASPGDFEDWFSFTLDDGQAATLSLAHDVANDPVRLELYDAAGDLLSVGVPAAAYRVGSQEQSIADFRDLTSDLQANVYYARVQPPPSSYRLAVTKDSTFELGVGNAFSTAQRIDATGVVWGAIENSRGGSINSLATIPSLTDTTFVPPDPILAVGPEQVVVMANTSIAAYDKATGQKLYQSNLSNAAGFFGDAGGRGSIFDPWLVYDQASERFFALGLELTSNTRSHIYLAVSKDATPTTPDAWHKYRIDFTHQAGGTGLGTGPHFPDYPKFSVSNDAVYVSGNYFPIAAGSGNYAGLTALAKAPLLAGEPARTLYQEYFPGFSVFPLQQREGGGTQYFAEAVAPRNSIRIHAVTDVATNPVRHTFELPVDAFDEPKDVPQLGGAVPANAVGSRVMTGIWRDGSAWFAHGIVDPAIGDDETVARWYQVRTNRFPAAPPSLVQSGNVDPGPGLHAWIPALDVNGAGSMAIGFSLGGSDRFVGAGYTGRLASDPPGAVVQPVYEWLDGQAIYEKVDNNFRNRWGDYSGLVVDPSDDETFWVFNEYVDAPNSWATAIGSFQLTAIPESDWYRFDAAAGESLTLTTSTPLDDPLDPVNLLDPVLEVFDPSGALVATDDNSGADARNAALTLTAAVGGAYRARVYGRAGTRGNYRLTKQPGAVADEPPRVLDSQPDPGQRINAFPLTASLVLSEPVLASSVAPGDLLVNGVPATSVYLIDGVTIEFTVDPVVFAGDGVYSIETPAGSFTDLQGSLLAETWNETFEVDTTGPTIKGTLWNNAPFPEDGVLPAGPLVFEGDLSEGVFVFASPRRGPFSPGKDDVRLVDRDTGAEFSPADVIYDAQTQRFTTNFLDPLPEGNYTLRIVSGKGAFADNVGNGLDGESAGSSRDGTPTGDGLPGGDYTIDFVLDAPVLDAEEFVALQPAGSQVYVSRDNAGILLDSTDEDRLRFHARAGQTIAAKISFQDPVSGDAVFVGLSAPHANAPGRPLVIPPTLVPADGFFELRLTGDSGSRYTIDLLVNGGLEDPSAEEGEPTAASLDGARVEIGSGQWAVLGETSGELPDLDVYTLDLAAARGSFVEVALSGQGQSLSNAVLQLLAPDGTIVADGQTGSTFDRQILEFPLPEDADSGPYSVRVSSSTRGEYLLLVTDGQKIETDATDDSRPRLLSNGGRALGHLAEDLSVTVEPDEFSSGTVLDTAVTGVTFSRFDGGRIFAADVSPELFVPPTGVRVFSSDAYGPLGFRFGGDELKIEFDEPISTVSLLRGTQFPATAALFAFDANNNVLEFKSSGHLSVNEVEEISITRRQADIASVAAAGISPVPFDRLRLAAVTPDVKDRYVVNAAAGEVVTLTASVPPGPEVDSENVLLTELVVTSSDGSQVLARSSAPGPGEEARVTFTATAAGAYGVEVHAKAGRGAYVLVVDRETPQAIDDEITVDEGGSATRLSSGAASVLANDVGLGDAPITVSLASPPEWAADFTLAADGSFTYTHDGSESFLDSFRYTVTDFDGQSSTARVHIVVNPVSDRTPLAVDDFLVVDEGGAGSKLETTAIRLIANDIGLQDTPILIELAAAPQFASEVVIYPDATFLYQHDGSENFGDQFTYRITDNDGQTSTAVVYVTINPVSDAEPTAVDDEIVVDPGQTVDRLTSGQRSVLANDAGLDDGPIEVTLDSGPAHAAAFSLEADGSFVYEHDGGPDARDEFVYRIRDNDGQFALGVVAIYVNPAEATPVPRDDSFTLVEGGSATTLDNGAVTVLANDLGLVNGPVTASIESPPAHAATFGLEPDGTFLYTHDGSENFRDQFVYRVTDADGDSGTATATIVVSAVSDADPTAVDDVLTAAEGQTQIVLDSGEASVLANDQGLLDGPILVSLVTPPVYAVAFSLSSDGTFVYEHDGSENFVDEFTYQIEDNDGQTSRGVVAVSITPVSDAEPAAQDDVLTVAEGQTQTVLDSGETSVLANDQGLLDGPVVVSILTPPVHAVSFSLASDGTFVYEHDGGEQLFDEFDYLLTDTDGQTASGRVDVRILPVEPLGEDVAPPTASAEIDDVAALTSEGRAFLVRYQDDDGISPIVLDSRDLLLVSPSGEERPIEFLGIRRDSVRRDILADYSISSPAGGWQPRDNGVYQIVAAADEVRDLSGNPLAAGVVGQFEVRIPTPPQVLAVEVNGGRSKFDVFSSVSVQFSQPVEVSAAALTIVDTITGQEVDASLATLTYDEPTRTAVWDTTALGLDPPGRYQLGLSSAEVFGSTGELDGDLDLLPGGDYVDAELFPLTWAGDVNLDLDVDFEDFLQFAFNFAQHQDAVWTQGDFDEDGLVDFSDFLLLALNFEKAAGPAVPVVVQGDVRAAVAAAFAESWLWRRDLQP